MIDVNLTKTKICYFEEILLNNLSDEKKISKSKIDSTCNSLYNFLNKNKEIIDKSDLINCNKIIQEITSDKNFSQQKIVELFSKLDVLKNHLISSKPLPKKINIQDYAQNLKPLEIQMHAIARIRKNLFQMRHAAEIMIKNGVNENEQLLKLSKYFAKNFHAVLENILLHAIEKLKMRSLNGPDLTKWCVVVLGSLAREEGHPYSDIDFLILVDPEIENDENAKKYFEALIQEFSDLVYQVGEESAGFKFCSGGLTPPYLSYDYRYANDETKNSRKRGMGSFFTSPMRLAFMTYQSAVPFMPLKGNYDMFKKPLLGNENLIGASLLDARPLLGNSSLFDKFLGYENQLGALKIEELFDNSHFSDKPFGADTTVEQLASRSILGMLTQKRSPADYDKKKLNIKKDFMRPIQVAISVLANQFGIKETNTLKRMDALVKQQILPKSEVEKIKTVYLQLYKMRIEEAVLFKGENDELITSEEEFEKLETSMKEMLKTANESYEKEKQVIASKVTGKEKMDDLLALRETQSSYLNESFQLFKLINNKRITNVTKLQEMKKICCNILDLINQYIALNCHKNVLRFT